MAQLAVSLAGAGIGFAIGGTQGARLGFTAGSILGRVLFPGELPDQNNTGSRLGDLKVTASSYGQAIPKLYGTVRIGGNCTWSLPIEEVKNVDTQTEGGKGGPSQTATNTSYNYYGTFAISFGEGVAEGVIRIWANGKLIYDKSDTGAVVATPGLKFRFYGGSEGQLPDSLEEADKGVGNTPAYRGQIRIVFDRLPLADYGNRHPNIEAEITMQATPLFPFTRFQTTDKTDYFGRITNLGVANATHLNVNTYDSIRKLLYIAFEEETTATLGYDNRYIACVSIPSMQIVNIRDTTSMWEDISETRPPSSGANMIVPVAVDTHSNSLICTTTDNNHKVVLRADATTLKVTHSVGVGDSDLNPYSDLDGIPKFQSCAVIEFPGNYTKNLILSMGVEGLPPVFDGTGLTVFRPQDLEIIYFNVALGNEEYGRQVVPCTATALSAYTLFLSEATGSFKVWYMNLAATAYYDSMLSQTFGISGNILVNITASVMNAASGVQHTITGLDTNTDRGGNFGYDPDTNAIIGTRKWSTASSSVYYAMSIDILSGTINWVKYLPSDGGSGDDFGWLGDLSKTQIIRVGISEDQWFSLDKYTGEIIEEFDPQDWLGSQSGNNRCLAIDYDFDAMIRADMSSSQGPDPDSIGGILFFNRGDGNNTTLDQIVQSLCNDAGLASGDINVTDLADTDVLGYMITQPGSSVRGGIGPLAQAYFFDAVESDYILKFVDRGGPSAATITQDDLGAVSNNDYWVHSRAQEQEMPMRVNVAYMDYDMDYQQGTYPAKRAQNPFPVMYSKHEVALPLPIVLDKSEAKQIAEKVLYNTWVERDAFSTVLSWEYLKLDPADIVTVSLDDGTTYEVRISNLNIGADLSLRTDTVSEEIANYTSTLVGETNFPASTIQNASGSSYLKVHNVPLLSDLHDQSRLRSVLYVQAGPLISSANWTGCTVYSSTDQITWNAETRIITELVYGAVQGTLAAPADVFAVDTTSTITIWPTVGGDLLTSTTYAQLLSGEHNIAIVGDEVINFQNVTDNGDGSYTLDTFLRGRRGTDTAADSHTSGEYFYLVNSANTEAIIIALDNIDSVMYFKAVGNGQIIEEALTVTLTPTGEDLKPYAVVNPVRTDDDPGAGDITVSAQRRTRINGSGAGEVPLNEDSEEYEVDILNGSGGAVVRTYDSLTEPEFTYTAADQATDSFSGGTLYFRMYQMSAQVGRGKSYEFALI